MAVFPTFEEIREEWKAEGLPNINSGLPDWSDNPITPCMVSLGDEDWPSPVRIINIVASEAGLSVRTLKSSRQDPHSIMARHIAVYFLRELRALSTPQIGQLMDKDHTTIMYALNRVKQKIRRDPDYLQFHDRVLKALREMQ